MKAILKLTLFSATLLLFISCVAQKQNTSQVSFEELVFNAQTRGRSENISLTNNKLTYKTLQESGSYNLTQEELQQIQKEIAKINLNKIATLKAPTDKRMFDGALIAHLTLKTKEGNFTSSNFDHDNPPSELKALIDLLRSYCK